jgi:hypothetical protein
MSGVVTSVSLSASVRRERHILGVRGGLWTAVVDERGRIQLDDGSAPLDWYVAADDRWHDPRRETTVRQQRRAGVPVIETRVRVPSGDVAQRVYAVADHGGMVVIEFTNDSPLPVAVALNRPDVVCVRTPSPLGPQGIDLPAGSVVFPVAHGSTLRVALPVAAGTSPRTQSIDWSAIASAEDMQRTWLAAVERAGYAVVPDKSLAPRINRLRSDLLVLGGREPSRWGQELAGDDIATVLSFGELVRMGERLQSWSTRDDVVDELARITESLLREHRAASAVPWDVERALFVAQCVFVATGEDRAARDVATSRARLASASAPANAAPDGVRVAAWLDEYLVSPRRDGSASILGWGIPRLWLGASLDCRLIAADPTHTVSFGVRWHGERPAVLWEVEGDEGLAIDAGLTDPTFHTRERTGEALLTGFVP